jgi:universal stress protein A
MQTLQSILVPIDGSPPSLAALEHAVVLAEDYDAAIVALHVIVTSDTLTPVDEIGDAIEAAVGRAETSLGRRISLRSAVGDPIREIVEAARDADLVVIGTHGFVGRLHELLGSVAEGVVRNAPCPVLTVHDASGGYQSFAERRHHRQSVGEQASERGADRT